MRNAHPLNSLIVSANVPSRQKSKVLETNEVTKQVLHNGASNTMSGDHQLTEAQSSISAWNLCLGEDVEAFHRKACFEVF